MPKIQIWVDGEVVTDREIRDDKVLIMIDGEIIFNNKVLSSVDIHLNK